MNNCQCVDCIHKDVCAYKDHYEDAVKLYEQANKEASKYPWFDWTIHCIKYLTRETAALAASFERDKYKAGSEDKE